MCVVIVCLLTDCLSVAHLVIHETSSLTRYEMIQPLPMETTGSMLSTVDMVVQRRDGPHRLRDNDDDDDVNRLHFFNTISIGLYFAVHRLLTGISAEYASIVETLFHAMP